MQSNTGFIKNVKRREQEQQYQPKFQQKKRDDKSWQRVDKRGQYDER
jgi:hypothetical protein